MTVRIGINGFGRIGKNIFCAQRTDPLFGDLEIVAINDLSPTHTMAHLLKYDSVLGRFDGHVTAHDHALVVDGRQIAISHQERPEKIPWQAFGVDLVVESTGCFASLSQAAHHLQGGARRVVISAPAGAEVKTLVMGVNEDEYDPATHAIVSNASCTTNCLAQVCKVIHDRFIIRRGFMTTVHAYTNDQNLLDAPHRDLRRARGASLSMIPTTTNAGNALELVMPHLKGRLETMSIRVPTPNVSLVDVIFEVEQPTTTTQVNAALRMASGRFLGYTEEPLVSVDFLQDPHSCIIDASCTRVRENGIKIVGWYDNEWGYACRVLDLIRHMTASESPS